MAIEYLGTGNDDGFALGRSGDKISFYGTTAAAQPSTIASVTTTAATTATPYGYSTSTQADAIVSALNSVVAALKTLGIIAAA